MKKVVISLSLAFGLLEAQELFTSQTIANYLDEKNPFVSTLLNREYIAKEQVNYQKSPFDTTLTAKYDKKEYPASEGEYTDVYVKKTLQNGIEFATGYREAIGTQEYNNIKTSDKGEMIASMKLPLVELFGGTNTNKTNLDLAIVESIKSQFNSNNNLRLFYLEVFSSYYTLLYNKLVFKLDQELLEKALRREEFVTQQVQEGALAEIALIELQQQILNRKQRVVESELKYENTLAEFVKYLNLSKESFQQRYRLKEQLEELNSPLTLEEALEQAKQKRADLKMLEYDAEKIKLQKKNSNLLKYPKINLTAYGVHDFKYDNGFKIALDFSFPIEQNRYKAQIATLSQTMQNIVALKQKKLLEIETLLTKIINSLNLLKQNIVMVQQEVLLAKKLEDAENTKYIHGQSDLFLINQREINTLAVEKKVLSYKLNQLLLEEQLRRQTGESSL